MRSGLRRLGTLCAVLAFSAGVRGQSTLVLGAGEPSTIGPYTAKFETHSEILLGNGTTIIRTTPDSKAVDSQGRTLVAYTFGANGKTREYTTFQAFDPVARTNTRWEVPGRVATVEKLPPAGEPGRPSGCWMRNAPLFPREKPSADEIENEKQHPEKPLPRRELDGPPPSRKQVNQVEKEDLGTQAFFGVEATGARTTTTIPTGAIGNDAPLVSVFEIWRANSPKMIVRRMTDDPRNGKRTRQLVDFIRGEPDPSAFQPPEGYEIRTVGYYEVPCARNQRPEPEAPSHLN